jgi:hypothetical protein
MKNRYTTICILTLALSALISACKKDEGPSVDDHFLNYEIKNTPPDKNYVLGAFYVNTGSAFNANIKEVPKVGKYGFPNGVVTAIPATNPPIMPQHIDFAVKAKIDYFIFSVRSATLDNGGYKQDSLTIKSFLDAPNAGNMKFAITYNFNAGLFGISSTAALETRPAAQIEAFYNDFKRLAVYFGNTGYMKVNNKPLLIINGAQNLNATSNPAVYTELRKRVFALGFELYIVGMQDRWSPPQRFYFRFQNCVDAMYEANMIDAGDSPDRTYLFPQMVDQNWKYWKQMLESWNIEFIPSIAPGRIYTFENPTSKNLVLKRSEDFYRTFCNVAKLNASKSGLIFIDSFNDFRKDTQIEPSESYGDLYLDITRQEFKLN